MQILLLNELDSTTKPQTQEIIQTQKEKIRLDECLANALKTSKSQISNLIKNEQISLNNKPCKKGGIYLKNNDKIHIKNPQILIKQQSSTQQTTSNSAHFGQFVEKIHIDKIYENDDFLILNKPPFLCVHSAPSLKEPTLVDWLKQHNIMLSNIAGEQRAGIVHRLDKQTSGAIIIAKNNATHAVLSEELKSKNIGRYYLALIDSPLKNHIIIESKIARHPKNRLKMANIDSFSNVSNNLIQSARYAKSEFAPLLSNQSNGISLICAKLHTGRTHQIRTHLEKINRHIINDTTYGFKPNKMINEILEEHQKSSDFLPRVFLHAYLLYMPSQLMTMPQSNIHQQQKAQIFCGSVFDDMLQFCTKIFGKRQFDEAIRIPRILQAFNDENECKINENTTDKNKATI